MLAAKAFYVNTFSSEKSSPTGAGTTGTAVGGVLGARALTHSFLCGKFRSEV